MLETSITRRHFVGAGLASALTLAASGCSGGALAVKTPIFDVELDREWICDSYDSTLLVVDYTVTNNDDMSWDTSSMSLYMKAKQGDKSLADGYITEDVEGYIESEKISKGESAKGQLAFVLVDDEESVSLTAKVDTTDYEDVVEVVDEEVKLADLEKVESTAGFEFSYGSAYATDDGEGQALVVLEYTFTNLEDSAQSASEAMEVQIFQNGTELKNGYLPYGHPYYKEDEDDNAWVEVQKDSSVKIQDCFELLDTTSPIEVKVTDWQSYDQRVVFDKELEITNTSEDQDKAA